MYRAILRALAVIWASPNSLLGLLLGLLTLLTGGGAQWRRSVIEFHGGCSRWLLGRLAPKGILAMTLGHTILGISPDALDIVRDHEHVHVRQYEAWGPIFLPAYLCCSLVAWWRGDRAYRDNYFERKAYGDE